MMNKKNIKNKQKIKKGLLETEWKEKRRILLDGREREVWITLKVFREEFGNYYDTYIYSFLEGYKITLLKAKIDNEDINLEINQHCFTFNFRKLYNGDSIQLYLKFKEKKSKFNKICRSECISLPDFLIGCNVNFFLFIPKVYDILYWKKGFIFEKLDNNNNDINGNKNINKISDKEIKSDNAIEKENKVEFERKNENNNEKDNKSDNNINENSEKENKNEKHINDNINEKELKNNKENNKDLEKSLKKKISKKERLQKEKEEKEKLEKEKLEKEKKENIIYNWKGIIDNGKIIEDYIYLNIKTSKWVISFKQNFKNSKINKPIKELIITIPKYFIGGNNNIISYNLRTNFSETIDGNNIKETEKNYILTYNNLKSGEGYYSVETLLINSPEKNYTCENFNKFLIKVSDKEKEIFIPLINEILKEDKSNNLNYIKLGNWVKKNIKYDKHIPIVKKNPIETYKSKKGTCNDLTNLYNCLLKLIGIKAIFVSGFVIEENKFDDNGGNDFDYHCWTLAEINNQFIPLDVNFQYFNGKIPSTHLFGCFGNSSIDMKCTDKISLDKIQEKIIAV